MVVVLDDVVDVDVDVVDVVLVDVLDDVLVVDGLDVVVIAREATEVVGADVGSSDEQDAIASTASTTAVMPVERRLTRE